VELTGLGRFADPAVPIRTSLPVDRHGYVLIRDVEEFAGATPVRARSMPRCAGWSRRGLIEAQAPLDRRRPYRTTAAGAVTLRVYLEHARVVAQHGLRRLAAYA